MSVHYGMPECQPLEFQMERAREKAIDVKQSHDMYEICKRVSFQSALDK